MSGTITIGSVFPLDDRLRAAWRRAAWQAAGELGLLAALPAAEAALAARLRLAPARLAALADALCAEDLLARQGAELRALAAEGGGEGELARFIVDGLRAPRPLPADDTGARFQAHLAEAARTAAPALWSAVGARGRLLDVGAGPGVYAAEWLRAGGASAAAIDRPAVVAALPAGVERLAADLTDGDAPWDAAPADTVLLANVLHLFSAETAARLVARAGRSGRRVVIFDLRCDDDRRGPPAGVWFSLTMALYTDGGRVHSGADLAAFCAAAGLRQTALHLFAPDAWALVAEPAP